MRFISRLFTLAFTAAILMLSLALAILAVVAKGVLWLNDHKHTKLRVGRARHKVYHPAGAHR
ncbi:MAG: hypothetical protein EPN36_14550 [Rhodanobacteraceae bacterium]|nr:MAG: hypothetical protein EPN36_14550 [Rhodanobacteraceae bacterium]